MSKVVIKKWLVPGRVDSKFNLGLIYKAGIGIDPDMEKAKHWLKLAAVQGDE